MRLIVRKRAGLYYLFVEEGQVRRPLLRSGEWPSWAGGWAGEDGLGGYPLGEARVVLEELGISPQVLEMLLGPSVSAACC